MKKFILSVIMNLKVFRYRLLPEINWKMELAKTFGMKK